jgi:cytochrome c-type biogenesis protein CcmH/NrfG
LNKPFAVNLTAISVTVVLTALSTYFLTTQFSGPAEQDVSREVKTTQSITPAIVTEQPAERIEPVDALLVRLKQRLETQKDDVDGWVLLSKSYFHLNRMEEANEAFEKAKALGYVGSWMPLPKINSFMHQETSSQKLKGLANFRDNKVGESSSQQ